MLLPNAMILILQFNILLLLSFCGIQIMLSDLTDFKKARGHKIGICCSLCNCEISYSL